MIFLLCSVFFFTKKLVPSLLLQVFFGHPYGLSCCLPSTVYVFSKPQEGKVQQKEEQCPHYTGRLGFRKEDRNQGTQGHHLKKHQTFTLYTAGWQGWKSTEWARHANSEEPKEEEDQKLVAVPWLQGDSDSNLIEIKTMGIICRRILVHFGIQNYDLAAASKFSHNTWQHQQETQR